MKDQDRINLITNALEQSNMDALVCALPTNVLLISGYWPVVGTAVAVITRNGFVHLLASDDEAELARASGADVVETFSFGSIEEIKTASEVLRTPLTMILREIDPVVIGCETGANVEPASYVGVHRYGSALRQLLVEIVPAAATLSADDVLNRLRSILSPSEQARVRLACGIAANTFLGAAESLRPGLKETQVVSLVRSPLASSDGVGHEISRAAGFVFCMSGPNSAGAYATYQCSRSRRIEPGDLVLIHCNSYIDGYWTDITRTFCMGTPDQRKREMYEAVLAARQAALDAIRPGVKAATVDQAARAVLSNYGFEKEFKHGLGHGVGFAAINHNAFPRLHPASEDVLEPGMIFNIEPAVYVEGFGGIRHCDMVLLTDHGPEVLTPFQSTLESLTLAWFL